MWRALLLATCATGCSGALWLGGTIDSVSNSKRGGGNSQCMKTTAVVGAALELGIAALVIDHGDRTLDAVVLPIIALDGLLGLLALNKFCD